MGRRVAGLPGVTSVGFASAMPMSQDYRDVVPVAPEGFRLPPGVDNLIVQANRIDEGYFDTMDVRLVAGRGIRASDTADTPLVMLSSMPPWPAISGPARARSASACASAGRRGPKSSAWSPTTSTTSSPKRRPTSCISPRAQDPAVRGTLVVAAQGDAAALAAPVRAVIAALDRELPVTSVRTMEEYYSANAQGLSRMLHRIVGSDRRGGPGARHGRALRARGLHRSAAGRGRSASAWRLARSPGRCSRW